MTTSSQIPQERKLVTSIPGPKSQELHQRTGLAKSTLHRLLSTLETEKYVRTDPHVYGHYQLTQAVGNLSCGVTTQMQLAELAAPIMVSTIISRFT